MTITTINNPTLKAGAQGAFVTELQQLLNALGAKLQADGVFGPATDKEVKAFQTKFGVSANGIVEHITWSGIYTRVYISSRKSLPILRQGSIGEAVQLLQSQLNLFSSQSKLTVDGDFGPATEAAVKALQKSKKLVVDGIVGPQTWVALPAMPTGR